MKDFLKRSKYIPLDTKLKRQSKFQSSSALLTNKCTFILRGIKVERVELKDVRLPANMQRAMATEAEATREARAKVISAEGEQKASIALKGAADVINQSPVALQLRYLQTLTNISAEKNSTIIFPVPIEMLSQFAGYRNNNNEHKTCNNCNNCE